MHILLCTDVIHAGGAETFVLRLANGLSDRGHKVMLFIFFKERSDAALLDTLSPAVTVRFGSLPNLPLFQKLDSLFLKLRLDFSPLGVLLARQLRSLVENEDVDVVHSHLFTADWVTCNALTLARRTGWVSTQHGDYRLYHQSIVQGLPLRLLHFQKKAGQILKRLDRIVCITDEQLDVLRSPFFPDVAKKTSKIFNGYTSKPGTDPPVVRDLSRHYSFVIGMVARGIEEKGWKVLIQAFVDAAITGACLVLIGEGNYLDGLKVQWGNHPHIYFIGKVSAPVDYIRFFSVGCLPSRLKAESLPTVIIEYLFCGKPVVATSVGEIPGMLRAGREDACGIVISPGEDAPMVETLKSTLRQLAAEPMLLNKLASHAGAAFQEFDMDLCLSRYEAEYQQTHAH